MGYIEEDESSTIDADSDIYSSIRSLKIIVFPKTVLVFIYSVLKFLAKLVMLYPMSIPRILIANLCLDPLRTLTRVAA